MEYLTATVNDAILQFNKIWEIWDQSEYSDTLLWLLWHLFILSPTEILHCTSGVYTFLMSEPPALYIG